MQNYDNSVGSTNRNIQDQDLMQTEDSDSRHDGSIVINCDCQWGVMTADQVQSSIKQLQLCKVLLNLLQRTSLYAFRPEQQMQALVT